MPLFEPIYGATPIEDLSDLIPSHITTRDELNEWESANILKATRKYLTKRTALDISVEWLKRIHREMFDETWLWAGILRKKNLNIGADWHNIIEQLGSLINDLEFWQQDQQLTLFARSVRLHHRLARIHPFINGNGRHARLVADIYLYSGNQPLPIWPDNKLINETDIRKKYIAALQAADNNDYPPLELFTKQLLAPSLKQGQHHV